MTNQLTSSLKDIFGFDDFRQGQQATIEQLLKGHSSLAIFPTGSGKSLCYQFTAIQLPHLTLVVSPLLALMKDQLAFLASKGIAAASIDSSLTAEQNQQVMSDVRNGQLKILMVSVERFKNERFRQFIESVNISMLVVDEAHCISEWGHNFRPDYLKLPAYQQALNIPLVLLLTATATKKVKNDMANKFAISAEHIVQTGFYRPNLDLSVMPVSTQDKNQQLLTSIQQQKGCGIVYVTLQYSAEQVADFLCKKGLNAKAYHAGFDSETRQQIQDEFMSGKVDIIVATIAFGMGIDKPDVRFVAHLDLPKSIESYYQETGRAGRDGQAANAWMVYGLQDVIKLKQMLDKSQAPEQQKRIERQRLDAMLGLCEITTCRRQTLLHYFAEHLAKPCGNCDTCITPVEKWDGTDAARKALSCVYRSGQRFGVNHLIDILLGKNSAKITQFQHQQLSTFGIGTELDTNQWHSVFRQLVSRGYIYADMDSFGAFKLTDKCRPLLRGEESIELRKDNTQLSKKQNARKSSKAKAKAKANVPEHAEPLWQALRALRKTLADEHGIPPFTVFHDSALIDMITTKPGNREQLLAISGVGVSKLDKYGDQFLAVLSEFDV